MEERRLLTVTSSFDESTAKLNVSSDANDDIVITADFGLAKVNGTSVFVGDSLLAANIVQRIEVTGGSGTQSIDLSAVTTSSFSELLGTTITLNAASTVSAHVIGSALDDVIGSNNQGNILEGLDGDDTLVAGSGDDTLIGGPGWTRFVFTDSAVGNVTIIGTFPAPESDDGNVLDFSQLSPNATTSAGIHVDLSDTAAQEVGPNGLHLTLSTDNFVTMVLGTRGDDWIKGGGENSSTAFVGGPGDDTLTGGAGGTDAFIFANWNEMPGWDEAGASHVTINQAVSNNNTLFFGDVSLLEPKLAWIVPYSAPVTLDLRNGMEGEEQWVTDDLLALTINGVGNFSTVFGASQYANVIYASDLDSMIVGGHNTNYLVGGGGTNLLVADPAAIGLGEFGVDGDSTLIAGTGNGTLIGGTGNDTLIGGSGEVQLFADLSLFGAPEGTSDGNNTLIGGMGNAQMFAGNGDDVLELGDGSENVLYLGTGTARAFFHRPIDGSVVYIVGGLTSQANTLDFSDYGIGVQVDLNETGVYDPDHLLILDYDPTLEDFVPLASNIHKVIGSTIGDNRLIAYGGSDPLAMNASLLTQGKTSQSLAGMSSELKVAPPDFSYPQVDIDGRFSGSFLRPRHANALTAHSLARGMTTSSMQLSLSEIDPTSILVAGDGNDTLIAGTGDDTLVVGAGDALLIGGSGDTTYVFNGENGNATLIAGQSQNWLDFSQSAVAVTLCLSSADTQSWGGGTITLDSPNSFQNVIGSAYDDFLCGNEANNYFFGGDGNDTLIGDGGDNFLVGGLGDNTLVASNGSNILVGGLGSNNLYGGTGSNLLVAGELTWADLSAMASASEREAVIDAVMSTWAEDAPLAERIANVTGAANATNPLPSALQFIPGVTLSKGEGQNLLTPSVGESFVYLNTPVDVAFVADPTNTTFAEIDPTVTVLTAEFGDGVLTVNYQGVGDVTYSIEDGFLLVNGQQPLEAPLAIGDVTQVVTQLGPLAGEYNSAFLFENLPNLGSDAWTHTHPLRAIGATTNYVNSFLTSQVGPDWQDFTDLLPADIADAINAGDYTLLWEAVCDGRTHTGSQLESAAWHDVADARLSFGLAILSESLSRGAMSSSLSFGQEGGTLDVESTEVDEGGVARFNVKFNAEYFDGCSVDWHTSDGSALGGRDYEISSGPLVWPDGAEGDSGFGVRTYDNYLVDGDRTFYASLSNIQNQVGYNNDHHEGDMSIGTSGTATIHNTSQYPVASIGSDSKVEGNHLLVPVTLDRVYGLPVTVNWSASNITTNGSQDFSPSSGSVTFQAQETLKYIDITTVNDNVAEFTETLSVTLTGATNATLGTSSGIGTIYDNDPSVTLSIVDTSAIESDPGLPQVYATFTLLLSTATTLSDVHATVQLTPGSALYGSDYSGATTFNVTIPAGATYTTIQVPITADLTAEPTEYFNATITSADVYITDSLAICTIYDTDRGVAVYINTDSNNDGQITFADDAIEESSPGRYVRNNDDDDNHNEQVDRDEAGTVTGEDDLALIALSAFQLNYTPAELAASTVTIEITSGTQFITLWSEAQKTQAIASGTSWSYNSFPSQLYAEGIANGTAMIEFYFKDPQGVVRSRDKVRVTVIQVDLDIDSDNTNSKSDPDRNSTEDLREDSAGSLTRLGKLLHANTANIDGDLVPDFADGFDMFGNQGANASAAFTPIILELSPDINLATARITFDYSASDPGLLIRQGNQAGGYRYLPAAGNLRLWTKDGAENRLKASISEGGDFIAANTSYAVASLPESARIGDRTWRLYVEAVAPSQDIAEQRISVSVNPTGSAAPTSTVSDADRSTVIDWRPVTVDGSGNVQPTEPVDTVAMSYSAPVVRFTNYTISNLHANSDGSAILGDIQVSGTVDSDTADFTPGSLGEINDVYVYLNGSFDPLGTISTVVTKANGTGSLLKPFDFSATFAHTFTGVELSPGFNQVEVRATEKVFQTSGSAIWAAEVIATEPAPTTVVVGVAFTAAPSPSVIDQVQVTIIKDGQTYNETLTETDLDSLIFVNATDTTEMHLSPGQTFNPGAPDAIQVYIRHDASTLVGMVLTLNEWGAATLNFTGADTFELDPADDFDYRAYSLAAGAGALVEQTDAGEAHPYLLQVIGPTQFLTGIDHLTTADGPRKIVESAGKYFLAMKAQGQPLRPAVLENRVLNVLKEGVIQPNEIDDYLIGVVKGFFVDGLWGSVEGAWGILKFVGNAALKYNSVTLSYRMITGDTFETERQFIAKAYNVTVDTVKIFGSIASKVLAHDQAVITAIITGDVEELKRLGHTYMIGAQLALEVFLDLAERMAGLSAEAKGRVVGMIVYEVVELLATAGVAKVTKAQFFNKLKTSARIASDSVANPLIEAMFQEGTTLAKVGEAVLDLTNKMCFVAGTKVHTDRGLRNIEELRVGDRVLARDEETGEQAYQPILETIVTHPERLYSVVYRLAGSEREDRLVCTGEHPFYVAARREFVPASELMTGDVIPLAAGSEAIVAAIVYEDAPPGEVFTTYNMEVERFHTYFVGEAGLWVHNAGFFFCDMMKASYVQYRRAAGGTPEAAARIVEGLIAEAKLAHKLSNKDVYEIFGSVAKLAAQDPAVFPNGPPAKLWTSTTKLNEAQNLGEHYYTHIVKQRRFGDEITDIVTYSKRAHGFIDNPPEGSIIVTRFRDTGNEIFVMDTVTGDFGVRKLDGPDVGAMKIFLRHEGSLQERLEYILEQFP
ncbi:MAG: polymorphic toxin-type HINT domain-containing protein [Pirellulales bacterium]